MRDKIRYSSVLGLVNFLHKGDRFLLEARDRHISHVRVFRSGTVDMDGHAVAKERGWAKGNHHYDAPENAYINVRFDDEGYSYPDTNTTIYQLAARHGAQYAPTELGRNAQHYLFVTEAVYPRLMRESAMTPEQLHPELKPDPKDEVKAEMAKIEAEMAALEARLAAARRNL